MLAEGVDQIAEGERGGGGEGVEEGGIDGERGGDGGVRISHGAAIVRLRHGHPPRIFEFPIFQFPLETHRHGRWKRASRRRTAGTQLIGGKAAQGLPGGWTGMEGVSFSIRPLPLDAVGRGRFQLSLR